MRVVSHGLVPIGVALLTAATAAAAPSDGTIARRTTFLVHDLDRSIDFYRTIGFEKWYEGAGGTVTGDGLPVAGVKIGDPSKLVIMKGKDPYVGMGRPASVWPEAAAAEGTHAQDRRRDPDG